MWSNEGFSITPCRHDEEDVSGGMAIPAPSKCNHGWTTPTSSSYLLLLPPPPFFFIN